MLVMMYIKLFFSGDQVIVVISPRPPFIWAKSSKHGPQGVKRVYVIIQLIYLSLAMVFQVKSCLVTPFKRK